ncbi:MAG: BON domain-containing protein [Firmicutes bacterium]|nr:BON domain-containing protein [Bacillota bacterium]
MEIEGEVRNAALAGRIRMALGTNQFIGGSPIGVTVHDGIVYLRGRVGTPEEGTEIQRVAGTVPGIKGVVSELTYGSFAGTVDAYYDGGPASDHRIQSGPETESTLM